VPNQSPDAIPIACCDLVNRGTAYSPSGKIYVQTLEGELIALDARTGKELWKAKHPDHSKAGVEANGYKQGATMTSAPIYIKTKSGNEIVIAGISGGEFGVRGRVSAFDANTGEHLWTGYSTGPDDEVLILGNPNPNYPSHWGRNLGATTWLNDEWKRGGGTTWGWYSYDPELDLLYYGTGGPGTWNPGQRPGDNKWSETIFARHPDHGYVEWAYQMTPHDEWDYDGVNEGILVDLKVDGWQRKALVHFDRNGFAYTIDRTSGQVLVAAQYRLTKWASRVSLADGLPVPNDRGMQGACPAHEDPEGQTPAAYSPLTRWFYVAMRNACTDDEGLELRHWTSASYYPGGYPGRLIAYDAAAGRVVWEVREAQALRGGVLTTAGGLVFYGTLDGFLKAVDQSTGKLLWSFKVPSGIIGTPMSYGGPDGRQYVAVFSGVSGGELLEPQRTPWLSRLNGVPQGRPTTRPSAGMLTVFGLGGPPEAAVK
jgi:lanthanide-dependent methanol dehydrogenase